MKFIGHLFVAVFFFLASIGFCQQLITPYTGDTELTDTIEQIQKTIKEEFKSAKFAGNYLPEKIIYEDTNVQISRTVDKYQYERASTHIGGYLQVFNRTYYKITLKVKNKGQEFYKITFSIKPLPKVAHFIEIDKQQDYTWTLNVVPKKEESVSFGTDYYNDEDLYILRVSTTSEEYIFTAPSRVLINETITLELRDKYGRPLEGVTITIIAPNNKAKTVVTDNMGKAKFSPVYTGFLTYKIFGSELDTQTEVMEVITQPTIETPSQQTEQTTSKPEQKDDGVVSTISKPIQRAIEKMPDRVRQVIILGGIIITILIVLLLLYMFFFKGRRPERNEDLEEQIERDGFVYTTQESNKQKPQKSEQLPEIKIDYLKEVPDEIVYRPSMSESEQLEKKSSPSNKPTIKTEPDLSDYLKQDIERQGKIIDDASRIGSIEYAKKRVEPTETDVLKEVKKAVSSTSEEEDSEELEAKLKRIRDIVKELQGEQEKEHKTNEIKKQEQKKQTKVKFTKEEESQETETKKASKITEKLDELKKLEPGIRTPSKAKEETKKSEEKKPSKTKEPKKKK